MNNQRIRAEAFTGEGNGTLRHHLFENAKDHIENSIAHGYYCEAIAVIESVITDRLESRLSYLTQTNVGFQMLGSAIRKLRDCESDTEIINILTDLDVWRNKRNRALHELVKIEAWQPQIAWNQRLSLLSSDATDGYELLKRIYHRVADLNPRHTGRVFAKPSRRSIRGD